ncbi:MAG: YlxR family protein [Desulfomonilia bacterium]
MDNRHQPYRQCIGCRSVRPKDELLRFVRDSSAGAVPDAGNTRQGRGFYLCPSERCFSKAFRNRRTRTAYFRKQQQAMELVQETQNTLLKVIEQDLARLSKMNRLVGDGREEAGVRQGDLVLCNPEGHAEETGKTHTDASTGTARAYRLPAECGCSGGFVVVTGESPLMKRLAKNLRKYEVLSSKGLAI